MASLTARAWFRRLTGQGSVQRAQARSVCAPASASPIPAGMPNPLLRKHVAIFAAWSVLVFISGAWNIGELRSNTLRAATAAARSSLAKDIGFRNWVGMHGGVYVPVTEATPINPYLKATDREIVTPSGRLLTLMNPAYVLRHLQQTFNSNAEMQSHLTSLKLFNPGNAPDDWERRALESFERGEREALDVYDIRNRPYLRLMLPLQVTQDCLKCHSDQGYRVGDVRGGIGSYVMLAPFIEAERAQRNELLLSHGVIWAIGFLGVGVGYRRERRSERQQAAAREELSKLSQALEQNPNLVLITDPAGHIEYVNEAFVQATGFHREDVFGRNPDMLRRGDAESGSFADAMDSARVALPWIREVTALRKNGSTYVECEQVSAIRDAVNEVSHFLVVKEDITQRKNAENEIRQLAFYDQLTGLPNRRLMMDRLTQALTASARHGRWGALLMIDLDNFKTLNDTMGHAAGDTLLIEAAERLKSCVRAGDTVARLGGDEFVVILQDLDGSARAVVQSETVAGKIRLRLAQPYEIRGGNVGAEARNHYCTSSIGVALFHDREASPDELMKRADTAMYQAKAAGRNAVRYFDPEMQAAVNARASLEFDLRRALVDNQFLLVYQPQYETGRGVTGVEALVRWQHPQRGLVRPSEFIPVAEDTGLILPLGRWILESACRQLAAWRDDAATADLVLADNVSARQFSMPNFVEEVRDVIRQTGAPAGRLKLEITETALLENAEDTIAKMVALKAHAVSFSLDDFGTGYSSLSYLKRLPLDQVKIDQSFVRDILHDPNDAAIAKTVIALGRCLGLGVIAEGVETAEQRDCLAGFGCDAYQGYLFGRPVPVEEFEAALRAQPGA